MKVAYFTFTSIVLAVFRAASYFASLHLRNKLYVKYMYIHAVISFDTLRMFICKSAHSRRLVVHNL